MEQFTDSLKKVLQAGIGAVATGVEKTQEVIESLSQKGEPLYEQAKTTVNEAAEKIKKAVNDSGIADVFSCRPQVQSIINDLMELTQEELDEIRDALEDIYPTRPRNRQEEAQAMNADAAGREAEEQADPLDGNDAVPSASDQKDN